MHEITGLRVCCSLILPWTNLDTRAVRAMAFVWKNLPIFLIWLTGWGMLDTALHRVIPPLGVVAWLAMLPLAVSGLLLAVALSRSKEVFQIRRYVWCAAVLIGMYMIPLIPRSSGPLLRDTHRLIYEASAIIEFIILALHGRSWLKGWDWAWVFGVTLVFGMILENGGIFMGFFTEEGYGLYLFGLPAPLATMVGWVSVLYCGFFVVERILPEMRPVLRGLACTGVALSMDIPFDPVATRLSWWVWNETLSATMWGVPVVNFVAWFWALFPYAWCYYFLREKGGMGEGRKIALFSALIPLILLIELAAVVMSLILLGDQESLEIVVRFFTFH